MDLLEHGGSEGSPLACFERYPYAGFGDIEDLEAGANIYGIKGWFAGLDCGQVQAVIEFAARSLDKPPAYAP